MLQLADVAGPFVWRAGQRAQSAADKREQPRRGISGDAVHDVREQRVEFARVLAEALPQRRDGDRVGAQPVVEVITKTARTTQAVGRLVRRGDHPPAEAHLLAAADRREDALLQHPQQLDLHGRGDLADFIEKNRPVRTASREDAFVRLHRARECALPVPEQLGLDERLGELREIDRHETAREAFGEALLPRVERDESGAPDCRCRRPFAGAGLAEQQRREILHPAPQAALENADVVREDIVPKPAAKLAHARALAHESLDDEVVRAADLKEDREQAQRLVRVKSPPLKQREQIARKAGRHGRIARGDLRDDEIIESRAKPLIRIEEQNHAHRFALLARILPQLGHPAFLQCGDSRAAFGFDFTDHRPELVAERIAENGECRAPVEIRITGRERSGFSRHAEKESHAGRECPAGTQR